MPYKDKEKDKQRLREYYAKNKELVKERGKKFYEQNRENILKRRQENKQQVNQKSKEWRDKNKSKVKKYKKKNADKIIIQNRKDKLKARNNLSDWYVVNIISKATKTPTSEIRKMPELIEEFKLKIILKRKLKELNQKIKNK